jgi:hypothetical protein
VQLWGIIRRHQGWINISNKSPNAGTALGWTCYAHVLLHVQACLKIIPLLCLSCSAFYVIFRSHVDITMSEKHNNACALIQRGGRNEGDRGLLVFTSRIWKYNDKKCTRVFVFFYYFEDRRMPVGRDDRRGRSSACRNNEPADQLIDVAGNDKIYCS